MSAPLLHVPFPGFESFGHFMPQIDINALHCLASKLYFARNRPLRILEVGTFTGASMMALSNYAEVMWCVDTWKGNADPADGINRIYAENGEDAVFAAFKNNTAHLLNLRRTLIYTSRSASTLFLSKVLDLVFLDGGHTYREVLDDIDFWLPTILPGGILCGHDIGCQFAGVKKAVDQRFLANGGRYDVMGNVWWKEV